MSPRNLILTLPLLATGCLSPYTTRFPTLWPTKNGEVARREAQVQDPFPDNHIGPETGFRPLGFENQRSEPQNTKDRFYNGVVRNQVQASQAAALPPGAVMLPPGTMIGPPTNAVLPPGAIVLQPQPVMMPMR